MIDFENKYFQKIQFSEEQIEQYFNAAKRDLEIASRADVAEVVFKFSYEALIKLGIALVAKEGYKVRSVLGHHVKIIEKLGQLLIDEDVVIAGNRMRQARNSDFYDGGVLITEKDSQEYLKFVQKVFLQATKNQ